MKRISIFMTVVIIILMSGCLFSPAPKTKANNSTAITTTAIVPIQTTASAPIQNKSLPQIQNSNFTISSQISDNGNLTIIIEAQKTVIPDSLVLSCRGHQFNPEFNTELNEKRYRLIIFDTNCSVSTNAYLLFDKRNITVSIPKDGGIWNYNLTEK